VAGRDFYDGPANFRTSQNPPAGDSISTRGDIWKGESLLHDTGMESQTKNRVAAVLHTFQTCIPNSPQYTKLSMLLRSGCSKHRLGLTMLTLEIPRTRCRQNAAGVNNNQTHGIEAA